MRFFLSFILLSFLAIKSSFALSAYMGLAGGAVNGKVKADVGRGTSKYSPYASLLLGAETNLLFVKFGIEGFLDQAIGLKQKSDFASYNNPLYYGAKGKMMFNLIFFDPYIAVGFGEEKASHFKETFVLGGLGVQAKILYFGAFAEFNYLRTSKSLGVRTERYAVQVGLKYYFL